MFKKRRTRKAVFNIFCQAGVDMYEGRSFPLNMSLLCHHIHDEGVDRWFRILSKQPDFSSVSAETCAAQIIKNTIEGYSPKKFLASAENDGEYKLADIVDEKLLKEVKYYMNLDEFHLGERADTEDEESDTEDEECTQEYYETTYGLLLVVMNRYR